MKIVRTLEFLKRLKKLGASAVDIERLETDLVNNPETGDVIPGSGGARKVRFAMAGKGKSGGGRAIYVAVRTSDTIYLLTAYAKSKQENLTADDVKTLKTLTKELKHGQAD